MELKLKIENNMGKAEEIAILEKLETTFFNHSDNYLASLFSNKFTNWASEQIRNDFPVNPMEYIIAYSEREWEEEIEDLKKKLENAQQEIIEINEVAHNTTKTTEYYREEAYRFEGIINEKNISIEILNAKINNLENCMVNLKAKLYDLLNNK